MKNITSGVVSREDIASRVAERAKARAGFGSTFRRLVPKPTPNRLATTNAVIELSKAHGSQRKKVKAEANKLPYLNASDTKAAMAKLGPFSPKDPQFAQKIVKGLGTEGNGVIVIEVDDQDRNVNQLRKDVFAAAEDYFDFLNEHPELLKDIREPLISENQSGYQGDRTADKSMVETSKLDNKGKNNASQFFDLSDQGLELKTPQRKDFEHGKTGDEAFAVARKAYQLGKTYEALAQRMRKEIEKDGEVVFKAIARGLKAAGATTKDGQPIPEDFYSKQILASDDAPNFFNIQRYSRCLVDPDVCEPQTVGGNEAPQAMNDVQKAQCQEIHTDINFSTFINQPTKSGVEILIQEDGKNKGWLHKDDTVNIFKETPRGKRRFLAFAGKVLANSTGGYMKDFWHRVGVNKGRLTMPYFFHFKQGTKFKDMQIDIPSHKRVKDRIDQLAERVNGDLKYDTYAYAKSLRQSFITGKYPQDAIDHLEKVFKLEPQKA